MYRHTYTHIYLYVYIYKKNEPHFSLHGLLLPQEYGIERDHFCPLSWRVSSFYPFYNLLHFHLFFFFFPSHEFPAFLGGFTRVWIFSWSLISSLNLFMAILSHFALVPMLPFDWSNSFLSLMFNSLIYFLRIHPVSLLLEEPREAPFASCAGHVSVPPASVQALPSHGSW